ncbi:MAG TPA: NfeD family protein [Opitutaceae bacterium]|nr:NfeD family protein [Opitutaceae bacterium]
MLADAVAVGHVDGRMSARGIFTLGTALAACWLQAQEPAATAEPAPAAPTEISAEAETTAPAAVAPATAVAAPPTNESVGVYVIPVRDQIADPVLFIIRRGLKEATDKGIKHVVLDMKTPGGALDTTLEIMETLDRFEGTTITYINNEAISAGAFIASITDEIWFAPGGVIGAAAPVLSTGGDIDESMKQKIVSYLRARVRAASEGKGSYRGEVISAMIDANYELKIGDEVLKPKGELLSLTESEAARVFGDPSQPLLSSGTAETLNALLAERLGKFEITSIEITWSERLAQYLTKISPLLLGLGLLALFIEFKTPGFGIFGISGILLLTVVFLSSSVAGLAGNEPILVFGLGLLLVAAEIFFFPGLILPAVIGVGMMFGSLVWALADIWPGQPVEFTADTFLGPIGDVMFGVVIAVVGAVVLARVIPRSIFWDRLVLKTALDAHPDGTATIPLPGDADPIIGKRGRALTDLFPSGQVEIDGRRYAAQLDLGSVDAGEEVVVTGRGSFGLVVERPRQ